MADQSTMKRKLFEMDEHDEELNAKIREEQKKQTKERYPCLIHNRAVVAVRTNPKSKFSKILRAALNLTFLPRLRE